VIPLLDNDFLLLPRWLRFSWREDIIGQVVANRLISATTSGEGVAGVVSSLSSMHDEKRIQFAVVTLPIKARLPELPRLIRYIQPLCV